MTQTPPKQLSNRDFGLIFAAIFTVIGVFPILFGNGPRIWSVALAIAFVVVALALPIALNPLNKAWVKFGLLMHKIVNPVLMGLVFFITVLPTGLIMRLMGKDPMRRKLDREAKSYWINRDTVIDKEFFDNQF